MSFIRRKFTQERGEPFVVVDRWGRIVKRASSNQEAIDYVKRMLPSDDQLQDMRTR